MSSTGTLLSRALFLCSFSCLPRGRPLRALSLSFAPQSARTQVKAETLSADMFAAR